MLYPFGLICLLFVATFLLGSVPWGVIISRLAFHKDIRSEGSGNIGATNAIRTLGKVGGGAVFVLDFGKGLLAGFFAVLAAQALGAPHAGGTEPVMTYALVGVGFDKAEALLYAPTAAYSVPLSIGFLGCVWGHIFSPWLKFHGGKGIAVAVGYLFFLFGPLWTLVELGVFIICVVATRYVSVGSIASAVVCPFIALYLYWGEWFAICVIALAAFTVVWAHRANMKRLAAGTESRIGSKGTAKEGSQS